MRSKEDLVPLIITAIDALAHRDDLADRVILAQLGEITENDRWGQEGTIEVVDVDRVTASVEWDLDGDKQMAKCFRTYWISDLKRVESPTNRGR